MNYLRGRILPHLVGGETVRVSHPHHAGEDVVAESAITMPGLQFLFEENMQNFVQLLKELPDLLVKDDPDNFLRMTKIKYNERHLHRWVDNEFHRAHAVATSAFLDMKSDENKLIDPYVIGSYGYNSLNARVYFETLYSHRQRRSMELCNQYRLYECDLYRYNEAEYQEGYDFEFANKYVVMDRYDFTLNDDTVEVGVRIHTVSMIYDKDGYNFLTTGKILEKWRDDEDRNDLEINCNAEAMSAFTYIYNYYQFYELNLSSAHLNIKQFVEILKYEWAKFILMKYRCGKLEDLALYDYVTAFKFRFMEDGPGDDYTPDYLVLDGYNIPVEFDLEFVKTVIRRTGHYGYLMSSATLMSQENFRTGVREWMPRYLPYQQYFNLKKCLLVDGDVESNPGPAYSKMRDNNLIGFEASNQVFGLENLGKLSDTLREGININHRFNFMESVKDQFPQFALLLVNLYQARNDKFLCSTILAQFLVGFDFSLNYIYEIMNRLYSKFLKFIRWVSRILNINDIDNASNEADDDEDAPVKSFIGGVFDSFFGSQSPSSKTFLKFCSNMSTIDKGVKGVESLIVKIVGYVKKAIDYLYLKVHGEPTNPFLDDLNEWLDRSTKIVSLQERSTLENEDIIIEVDTLCKMGVDYSLMIDGCTDKVLKETFKSSLAQLRALQLRFHKTAKPQVFKAPPYLISLYGSSGIGKSLLTPYIVVELLALDPYFISNPSKLREFAEFVHFRQTENEFWDSLQNKHRILCVDDFGQMADKMNSNEYHELIRLCNSAPAKAHMSSIHEKGMIELDFKAVILSTNNKFLKTENVNHPDAIARRFENCTWQVDVKSEFVKLVGKPGSKVRRLDTDKIKCDMDLSIYKFTKYDVNTGSSIGESVDYYKFIDIIKKEYIANHEKGNAKLNHLANYVENIITAQNQVFDYFIRPKGPSTSVPDEINEIVDDIETNYPVYYHFISSGNVLTRDVIKEWFLNRNCLNDSRSERVEFVTKYYLKILAIRLKVNPKPAKLPPFFKFILNFLSFITFSTMVYSLAYIFKGIFKCIYRFFKSIYNWFTGSNRKIEKVPKCYFRTVRFNGIEHFAMEYFDFVDDIYRPWFLPIDKFFLSKDKYHFILKDSVHPDDIICQYINRLNKQYNKDDSFKVIIDQVLSTPVENESFNVKMRSDKKKVDEKPEAVSTILERYANEQKMANKVINERYDTAQGIKTKSVTESKLEVAIDPNTVSVMNKITASQYFICIENDGAIINLGTITFIKGKLSISFLHLLPHIFDKHFYLRPVTWHNNRAVFKIDPSKVKVHIPKQRNVDHISFNLSKLKLDHTYLFTNSAGVKDLCILDFTSFDALMSHADITNHFVSVEDLSKVPGSKAILQMYDNSMEKYYVRANSLDPIDVTDVIVGPVDAGGIVGETYVREGYSYDGYTKPGDCGSLLYIENRYVNSKILGMHVSSAKGIGFAVSITKDILNTVTVVTNQVSLNYSLDNKEVKNVTEGVIYVGEIKDPIIQAGKTKIIKSGLHNVVDQSLEKPAFLHPIYINDKLVDPMEIAMRKYYTNPPYVPGKIIDTVAKDFDYYMSKTWKTIDKRHMRIFTLQEAAFGIEGEEYFSRLKMSTSPGYSWDKKHFPGKSYYFQNDVIHEEVIRRVEERLIMAKNNQRMFHLYTVVLKDETRPIAKVMQGKTRAIVVPQLDYTMLVRQYFGSWVLHAMKNKIHNRSLVGINMYGLESNMLFMKLKKHPNVLAGDFTSWDGTVRADIAWKVFESINNFYRKHQEDKSNIDEEERIRYILFLDLINAFVCAKSDVFLLTHSLPSGHPLTAIMNTMYNVFRSFLEYDLIMRSLLKENLDMEGWSEFCEYTSRLENFKTNQNYSIKKYMDNVEAVFYGDDLLMSVSSEFSKVYNYQTLVRANKLIGHIYTTSDKREFDDNVLFDKFEDATILKRHFIWNAIMCRWVAPLDKTTIREIPQWINRGQNEIDQLLTNIEVAAREMCLHGRKDYEEFCDQYRKALETYKLPPCYFQDYETLLNNICSGEQLEYLF
jgi:hypothetical protein